VEVAVAGGRFAGLRVALPVGEDIVGRGEAGAVRLDETSVSVAHMRVRVAEGAVFVADNDSTNGVRVAGDRLESGAERAVGPKETVEAGRLQLMFEPRVDAREAGLEDEDGWLVFNRPPRRTAPFQPARIRIAASPGDPAP